MPLSKVIRYKLLNFLCVLQPAEKQLAATTTDLASNNPMRLLPIVAVLIAIVLLLVILAVIFVIIIRGKPSLNFRAENIFNYWFIFQAEMAVQIALPMSFYPRTPPWPPIPASGSPCSKPRWRSPRLSLCLRPPVIIIASHLVINTSINKLFLKCPQLQSSILQI